MRGRTIRIEAYTRTGVRKVIGIGREVEGRHKDGSIFPIDLAVAEWYDARGRRFFTGIMRDTSASASGPRRRWRAPAPGGGWPARRRDRACNFNNSQPSSPGT